MHFILFDFMIWKLLHHCKAMVRLIISSYTVYCIWLELYSYTYSIVELSFGKCPGSFNAYPLETSTGRPLSCRGKLNVFL